LSAQQTDFSSARLYSKSKHADGRLAYRPIMINGLDATSRINGDPPAFMAWRRPETSAVQSLRSFFPLLPIVPSIEGHFRSGELRESDRGPRAFLTREVLPDL
jgi:hypothetical protein